MRITVLRGTELSPDLTRRWSDLQDKQRLASCAWAMVAAGCARV